MKIYYCLDYIRKSFPSVIEKQSLNYIGNQISDSLITKLKTEIESYFKNLPFKCEYKIAVITHNTSDLRDILVQVCDGSEILIMFTISVFKGDIKIIESKIYRPEDEQSMNFHTLEELIILFTNSSEEDKTKFLRNIAVALRYIKQDPSLLFDKALNSSLNIEEEKDIPETIRNEINTQLNEETMFTIVSSMFSFPESWNGSPLIFENISSESVNKIQNTIADRFCSVVKNPLLTCAISSSCNDKNIITVNLTVTDNSNANKPAIYCYAMTIGTSPNDYSFKRAK